MQNEFLRNLFDRFLADMSSSEKADREQIKQVKITTQIFDSQN